MKHNAKDIKMLRYVYILDVDNRGEPSKFYGLKKIYYVGQSHNVAMRFTQHLSNINSRFLTTNFKWARIIPRYIEYIIGTEYDAMVRENEIKRYSREKKEKLFDSPTNCLKGYRPCKRLILSKYQEEGEVVFKI